MRCGALATREPKTGMGDYCRCGKCSFRWTREDEKRPMSYMAYLEKGVYGAATWLGVPDGCLFVAEGGF